MSGSKHSDRARSILLALLAAAWASPAAAQAALTPEAQMVRPAQEFAVIGRETIPIPLLSIGGNQASVTQSGQSNVLNLDQRGGSVATTQQIGLSNTANVAMRGDQSALFLVQTGSGNAATVTTSGPNTVNIQQNGDRSRSDITLNVQGATVTSQQNGSNLSNAISQSGVGKAVTVVQSQGR